MINKVVLFLILGVKLSYAQLSVVSYTESTNTIANPERGLQKYSITDANYKATPSYSNIDVNDITDWRTGTEKATVIYRLFLLDDFLNANISQIYLDNMQIDFNRIRSAGLKAIVRFSYSDNITASPQQPNKAQILQHIAQFASLLTVNKDIIISHQAGFIGTYGEWYYTNSTEFGTEDNVNTTQWNNRKEILDAMLLATPNEVFIQVRYPQIKKKLYGLGQLDSTSAFLNTANARIGFFNDALLNDYGDQGTYSVNSQYQNPVGTADYLYLSNETQYTPLSGETNGVNAPRTNGSNALYELDLTNFSILNRDYYTQNFTNWINSGDYNNIIKRLGYRFVLKSSEFNLTGNNLSIKINIENKGFANAFNARDVNLIVVNTLNNSKDTFLLNTDSRYWDSLIEINQTINVSSLNVGNYACFLSLADKLLPGRAEYAIQFANVNTWVDSLGINKLNQTLNLNAVGVNKIKTNDLVTVYPNPANSVIHITTPSDFSGLISLLDAAGKTITAFNSNKTLNTIDLTDFKNGVYYVNIILQTGEVINKKVVVLK